jgi:hypothetical protein
LFRTFKMMLNSAELDTRSAPDSASGGASGGYVDLYELLGAAPNASTIQLRSRINEMFGEAQANRDHRNLDRRQNYNALLHWLPVCRAVLLHEGKRAKYDAYAHAATSGQAPAPFKEFLDELAELPDGVAHIGAAPLSVRAQERASTAASTAATTSVAPAAPDAARPSTSAPPRVATPASTTSNASTASAAVATAASAEPLLTAPPDAPAAYADAADVAQAVAPAAAPAVRMGRATVNSGSPIATMARPRGTAFSNPELRRELMSLVSSAAGALVGLAALLVARVVLKQSAIPAAIFALAVGVLAWAVLRAVLVGKGSSVPVE